MSEWPREGVLFGPHEKSGDSKKVEGGESGSGEKVMRAHKPVMFALLCCIPCSF